MATNCKIVTKLKTNYVRAYGINPESLANFLGQYMDFAGATYIEDDEGEIDDIWEMSVSDAKMFVEKISRDYDIHDRAFDKDTNTVQDVICLLNSWIKSNEENKEALERPDTIIVRWINSPD